MVIIVSGRAGNVFETLTILNINYLLCGKKLWVVIFEGFFQGLQKRSHQKRFPPNFSKKITLLATLYVSSNI